MEIIGLGLLGYMRKKGPSNFGSVRSRFIDGCRKPSESDEGKAGGNLQAVLFDVPSKADAHELAWMPRLPFATRTA